MRQDKTQRSLSLPVAVALLLVTGCGGPPPQQKKPAAPRPVRILQFYPSRSVVTKGETFLMCYGVENATAVRIEPPVEELKPMFNRCFPTTAQATTAYRLVAEGADGNSASQSVTVKVTAAGAAPSAAPERAETLIDFFNISANEASAGQELLLCYGVKNTRAVKIDPPIRQLEPLSRFCFSTTVEQSTTFILTATGDRGSVDRMQVSVRIR